MNLLVVYYSLYGHVHKMAEAVAQGAREVQGARVEMRRVPETLLPVVLEKMGAAEAQWALARMPVCTVDELADADAIIFGTPVYFGKMASQMSQFIDMTSPLWFDRSLVGKLGSAFCSSGSQHGGMEAVLLSFHTVMLNHGMIVVGLPYTFEGQRRTDEVTGGTPYGASTISGARGDRMPTENELAAARFQGKHVATIATRLFG
ncbi:MAG: NAD(P)H:quinone oxidoreductase [Methanosarcinales archaeon]|nr:NAD(P)H:quinone oxidoreductase [Methanosarcinales archaeon]